MSTKSWKNEYMPCPLRDCHDVATALQYVYLKWTGMKEENLKKHGLAKEKNRRWIYEIADISEFIIMSSANCALCAVTPASLDGSERCMLCVLQNCKDQWLQWVVFNRTAPMLELIHRAAKREGVILDET